MPTTRSATGGSRQWQSAVAVGGGQPATTNTYVANRLNQYAPITNSAFSASPRETLPAYDLDWGPAMKNHNWKLDSAE
jgi:hypothetical protein